MSIAPLPLLKKDMSGAPGFEFAVWDWFHVLASDFVYPFWCFSSHNANGMFGREYTGKHPTLGNPIKYKGFGVTHVYDECWWRLVLWSEWLVSTLHNPCAHCLPTLAFWHGFVILLPNTNSIHNVRILTSIKAATGFSFKSPVQNRWKWLGFALSQAFLKPLDWMVSIGRYVQEIFFIYSMVLGCSQPVSMKMARKGSHVLQCSAIAVESFPPDTDRSRSIPINQWFLLRCWVWIGHGFSIIFLR